MAALAGQELAGQAAPAAGQPRAAVGRRGFTLWRWLILLITAAYFLIPLLAAARFAGLSAMLNFVHQDGFGPAFVLSVRLALITTVITLALMLPTTVYVHLRLPRLRRLLEGITILPIVIPPIVLIVGVLQVAPAGLKASPYLLGLEYVILGMPFAYRSLDAGLQSIDLVTLVEAAGSLGAGWLTTLWRVLLPNLRSAMLSATVLIVALVLGEFTMASLDQYQTFPVWIVAFDQDNAQMSVAASLMALLITWICLLAISMLGRQRPRRAPEGES
jgi:putative spermidine/putrescine transport system permease protein